MIALSLITSVTAAETKTATTPAPQDVVSTDCSKMTDAAAKKECEDKAKQEAPASTNTAPMTK